MKSVKDVMNRSIAHADAAPRLCTHQPVCGQMNTHEASA